LVDSMPLVLRSIAHALEPFSAPRSAEEIFAHLGGPPERFLTGLVGDVRHVPAAAERMARVHDENLHLITPFGRVRAPLSAVRARGLQLAIWTGRDRQSGESLLAAHGLGDLFATIVYGDDLPTHKPSPEGLREILQRCAVKPAEAVFVGDADVDVL